MKIQVYKISEGIAVDIFVFHYRIRWYSKPHYFKIQDTRGWVTF